ncbi:hypothetical protein LR48_Vigan03g126200 [Vigna angularis]|uniref:Uncharacterized protein n=1 Tax=Phaseolus angularis TaxID=3914 RepID=A0A0L9U513_PHAAN|nr:hypothetical protein LR48_Vigan03g126200 [Vigna angularis]
MTSSSGKRIKTLGSKRKDKEPNRSYSDKFLSRKHERHFNVVQDRRLLMERKVRLIPDFAPQLYARMQSIHKGKVATAEMIIEMYDTPATHRWTMDEFHNVVSWPEEQAQGSRARAAGASAMDDEDDEEEEDSDDIMG